MSLQIVSECQLDLIMSEPTHCVCNYYGMNSLGVPVLCSDIHRMFITESVHSPARSCSSECHFNMSGTPVGYLSWIHQPGDVLTSARH